MAVPVLRTWTQGELGSSAELNSNVRDAGNFILFPPYVFLTNNSPGPSIPASTWTVVTWNADLVDTDNMHTGSSSQIVASTPGRYDIQACAYFAAATDTGVRAVQIRLNSAGSPTGGTQLVMSGETASTTSWPTSAQTSVWPFLNSGDYVEVFVWQSSGSALTLACQTTGDMQTFVSAQFIATS